MSEYKSLYRKYRPRSFEQVVGQEHVVKTLKNILVNEKINHAYLFSGPKGTGKTSINKDFLPYWIAFIVLIQQLLAMIV
ncbi:hypothetical protein ONA24_03970 [Mycoplasmopsis cynos]|uniref:hypothetical protein n=1 Tax=Mycoplasmopsis cynos TaxID=171284 RepID=UPI0024CA0886|nr:hypothetical protein [Mycoplasmopsis cynos]WAM09241.1 hypothetical protein ONA24_03970 [Mycoplasmopsis cynos]